MNILIIDNSIAFTGALKAAIHEAKIFSGDHHFTFVVPPGQAPAILREHGFTVFVLPMRELRRSFKSVAGYPLHLVRNVYLLKKILKRENVDVIQVNDFYNLLGALVKLTGFKGKLITYVRFLPVAFPAVLRKSWLYIAQKYSFKVVAVSDAVFNMLPPHEKNLRIYDPVYLPAPSLSTSREKTTVKFLYLANFIPGKGQDIALDAFTLALRGNQSLELRFVGGDMGLAGNQAFRKSLEERVSVEQLSAYILFAGFCDDIEKEIAQADVVLNFSGGESFSMTCLEASFYGKPVIATKCGGPSEIIVSGETGLLVPVDDVRGMAEAMLVLAADRSKRESMGMAARAFVLNKFSCENFREQFKKLL